MRSSLHRSKFHAKGFTLLEVLTVLALIGVLVGLSAGGARAVQMSAKKKKTATQIKTLSLALEKYYKKYGEYPVEKGPNGSKCLYQALSGDGSNYLSGVSNPQPSTGTAGSTGAVILEILSFSNLTNPDDEQSMIRLDGQDYVLVDPFGNEFRYHALDPKYNQNYDLYSIMKDDSESNPKSWAKNW